MRELGIAGGWVLLLGVGIRLLVSRLLRQPLGTTVILFFTRGTGAELEQLVRQVHWRRRREVLLLLVDCGLNREGLTLAQTLSREYPWVACCPQPALEDYLSLLQDRI